MLGIFIELEGSQWVERPMDFGRRSFFGSM